MKHIIILVIAIFVSACASNVIETIERIQFNVNEYKALPKTGQFIIKGKAFLKTTDGEIKFPENYFVRLNPKTSYSEQWYNVNYVGHKNIGVADPRYFDYVYKTKTDKNGNFKFKNIPAGEYYISAPIFWMKEIPQEDGSIYQRRLGKFICYEIIVKGDNVKVINITTEKPLNVSLDL